MKRCILHVGHAKNATTYLQTALHLNERKLAESGFWLPSDFTRFGSYNCRTLAEDGEIFSGNMQPVFDAYYAQQHDLVNELLHHIFYNGAENIILSSELLFYYNDVVWDIGRRAAHAGYELTVVAYLSRQDIAAIAAYLQNVRNHDFYGNVIEFLESIRREKGLQYFEVLASYNLQPPARIIVRTFDHRFLVDGDILSDFLSVCSCSLAPETLRLPGRDTNASFPLEWYEILRGLNAGRDSAVALFREKRPPLDANDRDRLTEYYFRPEIRDYIVNELMVCNEQLIATYLADKSAEEREYWANVPPSRHGLMLDTTKMAECLACLAAIKAGR